MSTAYTNLQIQPEEAQMDVVRRINVAALIKEVDRHPLLYNNTPKQSCSSETKRKIWENIAEYLCGIQHWQLYNESEKDVVVREIQLKWKNLKDNYHRILRKEKEDEAQGIPAFKRKKYIYYDALEFLKPYAPSTRSNGDMKEEMDIEGGKNAPHIIYINETNDSEEDSLLHSTSPTIPKQVKVQTPTVTPIAPLPQIPSFGTLQPVQFIHLQPNATIPNPKKDDDEESATSKLTKVLEQLVKTQEDDKNDDPMGNKKFLMSLVPFLRKLPDDVNLEVRLQIMGVIQSYGAKELF